MEQLIQNALHSNNNAIREEGQRQLDAARLQNPSAYLLQCARLNSNQQIRQYIRQSAGILIGRAAGLQAGNAQFWDLLDNQSKNEVKTLLLTTLASNSELSKRAAASSISIIAAIEVLRGEWVDLIPLLVANTRHNQYVIKRTSIMCLGFICEQFKQAGKNLGYDLSSEILVGILMGIKKQQNDLDTRRSSFSALRDSLAFLGNVTNDKQVRDHVANNILEALGTTQLVNIALQTLVQFARHNYTYLEEYVNVFFNFTQGIINQHNKESLIALQLWSTIGEVYLQSMRQIKRLENQVYQNNYLANIHEALIPILLNCLIIIDNEENEMRQQAIRTLTNVVECCGSVTFNALTNYISNAIMNDDWKIRQSSVLVFSTMCECAQVDQVAELLQRGLDIFMEQLSYEHLFVVESTLMGLSRIFEQFSKVFLQHTNYSKNITLIIQCLHIQNDKIKFYTLRTISTITEGLKECPDCKLAEDIFQLLNILTKYAQTALDPQEINIVFNCILNLLQVTRDANLAINYIKHIVTMFNEAKGPQSTALKCGILTALNSAILVLTDVATQKELLQWIYQFIIGYFNSIKDVDQDGLYVISAIAIVWKGGFVKVLQDFWPYLLTGLAKNNQAVTFKTSLNLLSDIARSLGNHFITKFHQVINSLITLIEGNIDRTSKIQVFYCIADCVLAVRESGSKYLEKILRITDIGFDGVIMLSRNGSPDDFDYSQQLKDALIDMYSCLNYAFNDSKSINPLLKNHFPKLIAFVIESCRKQINPTVQYIKNCVLLVVDSAFFYKAGRELNTQQFKGILTTLKNVNSKNKDVREAVAYAQKCINSQGFM